MRSWLEFLLSGAASLAYLISELIISGSPDSVHVLAASLIFVCVYLAIFYATNPRRFKDLSQVSNDLQVTVEQARERRRFSQESVLRVNSFVRSFSPRVRQKLFPRLLKKVVSRTGVPVGGERAYVTGGDWVVVIVTWEDNETKLFIKVAIMYFKIALFARRKVLETIGSPMFLACVIVLVKKMLLQHAMIDARDELLNNIHYYCCLLTVHPQVGDQLLNSMKVIQLLCRNGLLIPFLIDLGELD